MFKKIKKYISRHKFEAALLLIILLTAAFLRLYRIGDYMVFLGDEGRDVMIAREILQGKLTLLGPRASAGDFFLGPVYYYMIAPFLLLFNYDPVGPAVMVALFGVATVFLIYFAGLKFYNAKAGLIGAFLYSISPLVITYSRSSWNPNVMPFFSLLTLLFVYYAVKQQNHKKFIVSGILLGTAMQLHYLSTFLAAIIFFYILSGELIISKKNLIKRYLVHLSEVFGGFLIGLSPFLLFEIKHGFPNIITIFKFIFIDTAVKNYPIHQSFIQNIFDVFFKIFGRLVTAYPADYSLNKYDGNILMLWTIVTLSLAIAVIIASFYIKEKLKVLMLLLWLFTGIILFGFYKKEIYDYYLGFVFPLPFILTGIFLSGFSIKKYKIVGYFISIFIFLSLVIINLISSPLRNEPNMLKNQAKTIAEFVLSKTDGKPFNFALLSDGNSDHVYRYFFDVVDRSPITILNTAIDKERKSVTSQLLIVCESKNCSPLGNALWEVAGFGRAEIEGEWDVSYVKIYKLAHYKGD